MIESILTLLAVVVAIQALGALLITLRSIHHSRHVHTLPQHRYQPKTFVIVPCKGFGAGKPEFEGNIRGFCNQDYRDYELVFVTENENDDAYASIAGVIRETRRSAWLVTAGEAVNEGQKIHNLRVAVETMNSIDRRAEVIVFADSDFCPHPEWLAEIATSVDGKRIGAATGYRWFVPQRRLSFSSVLLSVWNSSALSVLGERSSFAWGGSTAIMRATFDKLGVSDRWRGAVSDDYVLSRAVQESGMRIQFVSGCLVPSEVDPSFSEVFEFTTRQMRITRVCAPRVWQLTLVTNLLFNVTFWGGLLWLIGSLISGTSGLVTAVLAILLGLTYVLGALNSWMRLRLAVQVIPQSARAIRESGALFVLLGPVAALLYAANLTASLFSRRIIWAGIGYEMLSSNETKIFLRPAPSQSQATTKAAKKAAQQRA
jgi:ceramide glucosyltransferase